jgi:AcrR family transcriptional regulator
MATNRKDGTATRQRLLDAAGALFAAKGYRDATTVEICRRARANGAAVNYHFTSKARLYVQVWRHAFDRSLIAHPPTGGVAPDAPAEERLRGRILAQVRRMLDPNSIDFDIAHMERANPTGLLSEVMRRTVEPLHQGITDIVRELLGARASERQVQLGAMSIHAQCFASMKQQRPPRASRGVAHPPPCRPMPAMDADTLADHIFRFSLAGLRAMRRREPQRSRA